MAARRLVKDVLAAVPAASVWCVAPGATSFRGPTTEGSSPTGWWCVWRARRTRARRRPSSTRIRRSPTARLRTSHVEIGNHDAVGTGLLPLRGWLPIEVFHFSFRTVEQVEKKGRGGWWSRPAPDLAEHIALAGPRRCRGARRGASAAPDGRRRGCSRGAGRTARSRSTRACETHSGSCAVTTARSRLPILAVQVASPPSPDPAARCGIRRRGGAARGDRRHRPRRRAHRAARGAPRAAGSGAGRAPA